MRSTAEARRAVLLDRAVAVFARNGYHATPVTAVAAAAGISEAYALRLFTNKLGLFTAAVETCYDRILQTLETAAATAPDPDPDKVLQHLGDAYANLIADKNLLMLQVHAQSVSDVPEIKSTVRAGYKRLVAFLRQAGADDGQIQLFIAYGQLCHLIVTAGLDDVDDSWARALTAGMTHVSHHGEAR
ncbi:TetR/AcrR family transcriptional regulator [Dactylosporangium matsuzakiense]|uniref:TetR family transcriptional regulator n=1 Tax=Dactylosporangium matsuzakiense TaxID=53360 RepID=A0A9W6KHN4_9ACTN|nr:TetR/AcrR family transcriptional regulator [Dactylosporangium matsuzakiense]GLL02252.1 TetR family transcriptional regulator [Dactylosporangium matsuzakiense]